ncbi:hypothetical protein DPMN_137691 [Dreissena polymorpha]|uniref:Uncharacterized protein n=1 Tax=Dreissena polymorpha TaxID=45954 RepID=A0A9D4JHW4_DREPO|nr:hypothetical protein DPMN_137691 [Dreissena polymorpha]
MRQMNERSEFLGLTSHNRPSRTPEERSKDARGRTHGDHFEHVQSGRRSPAFLRRSVNDEIVVVAMDVVSINDGLQAAAAALHTFSVTDSDDLVTSSIQAPEATFFEVEAATSPAVSPYVVNVDCTDAVTVVNSTFTQPVLDKVRNGVFEASIDFNDQAVPLPLTIKCTDGNVVNDITGTFNVNIVDSPPVFTALPATGTNIFDGLKHATETLHTFSVIDSDDAVMCSARSPENALFEVGAGVAPRFTINVKAGVTLRAANGPYVINFDCSDGVNNVTSKFTQPVIDTPPTFVSGIPGSSPNVSDVTVTQTLLGKFTTTDPHVTSPSTTVYEIRNVTSPVNVSQPELEVWISSTVTESAIDFNDQAVPLALTIRCTDGNPVNVITGTFNVNIVDEFLQHTSFPALQLNSFSLKDSDDAISCKACATPEATHFEIRAGTVPGMQISLRIVQDEEQSGM